MKLTEIKSLMTFTMIASTLLLTACANFNSELQCPYQQGVSCRSLSDIDKAIDRGEFEQSTQALKRRVIKSSAQDELSAKVATPMESTHIQSVSINSLSKGLGDLSLPVGKQYASNIVKKRHRAYKAHKTKAKKHRYTLQELRAINERYESLQYGEQDSNDARLDLTPVQKNKEASSISGQIPVQTISPEFEPQNTRAPVFKSNTAINASVSSPKLRTCNKVNVSSAISSHFNTQSPIGSSFSRHNDPQAQWDNSNQTHQENDHTDKSWAGIPKRTKEQIITLAIPAYVDEQGDYHEPQVIHHVVRHSNWVFEKEVIDD